MLQGAATDPAEVARAARGPSARAGAVSAEILNYYRKTARPSGTR